VIPLLLFGSLVRGSFFLIEKAIAGTAQAKEIDRNVTVQTPSNKTT